MRINPNLNIDQLKEDYEESKNVIIHNFLVEEDAELLWDWLANKMPEDWWFTAMKAGGEGYDAPLSIRRTDDNIKKILNNYSDIYNSFHDNEFSYIFDRTHDHVENCGCTLCNYINFFSGAAMNEFVNNITGVEQKLQKGEIFASRFTENQFLSPHHDHKKGTAGTVYSLTKGWHPSYGGNLYILEQDYKTIKKVVISTFNRLVLFDIPSRNGIPHYVSHVVPGVRQKRLSVTGWLAA
tara:strand:- start:19732 stop:20445 length:714 start_codon:yes stop_codon:yes gene_type:complete